MVAAADLVVEVLELGTDRAVIHLHSTEETVAMDHHRNRIPAI